MATIKNSLKIVNKEQVPRRIPCQQQQKEVCSTVLRLLLSEKCLRFNILLQGAALRFGCSNT